MILEFGKSVSMILYIYLSVISPATKMVSIFVGIAAIAVMMPISARGEALADPHIVISRKPFML